MTIQSGNLASADDVMNAIGSNFADTAQTIFNADYIGWSAKVNGDGVPQLKNVDYDLKNLWKTSW